MKNQMKKWMKAGLITAMAAVVFCLSGCAGKEASTGGEESGKPAAAYVVANTANTKKVDSSAPLLQDTIGDCVRQYGYLVMIRVDGDPQAILVQDLDIPEKHKQASKERLEKDALSKTTNLLEVLGEISAVHPEVDYLEGLRCAASALNSLDDSYTSRTIILCGSGLSTSGYLNFQNNLLSGADPQTIVEMLKEREMLPDLSGIDTVYWLGMGEVEEPQEKLSPAQKKSLEAIWKAVIEEAGSELVENTYISVADEMEKPEQLPSVSTIDLPEEQPVFFDADTELSENAFQEPVILGEDQVQFVGDQAEYLHPDAAVETIRPIAEYLNTHKTVNLLLVGCTAGDITDDAMLRLSKDRAETVRKTLVEFGVPEERLTTVGMAAGDPWHIENAGYEGSAASANRKVVFLDASTSQAEDILANNAF